MNAVNHQSEVAKVLCTVASYCKFFGWVALVIGIFCSGLKGVLFIVPIVYGLAVLGLMYLNACIIRGFAIIVEAAHIYCDKNASPEEETHSEEETQSEDEKTVPENKAKADYNIL